MALTSAIPLGAHWPIRWPEVRFRREIGSRSGRDGFTQLALGPEIGIRTTSRGFLRANSVRRGRTARQKLCLANLHASWIRFGRRGFCAGWASSIPVQSGRNP